MAAFIFFDTFILPDSNDCKKIIEQFEYFTQMKKYALLFTLLFSTSISFVSCREVDTDAEEIEEVEMDEEMESTEELEVEE